MAYTDAYPIMQGFYPYYSPPVVAFSFGGLARTEGYGGSQYYITNMNTGWVSGWNYTPSWSLIGGGQSSNFNVPMSPGYTYMVEFRIYWDNQWWDCSQYSYFSYPASAPTGSPYVTHYSSSGTTINLQVQDAYGATSIGFTPSWGGTYTSTVYSTPYIYSLSAPQYGTEYEIGKKGYNDGGESSRTYVWATTEPAMPSITSGGNIGGANTITINVNPTGGWTQIQVEMHSIGGGLLATRTQGWNGGGNFSVQFGSTDSPLTPNASYQFRVIANKTSSYSNYHPTTGWGNWLTVKNNMARPINWEWYTPKTTGQLFSLTANEWNTFTARINQFRTYKGLSSYPFTSAVSGGLVYFYLFNEARAAIDSMASTGLGTVSSGTTILASSLNILRNTLNIL